MMEVESSNHVDQTAIGVPSPPKGEDVEDGEVVEPDTIDSSKTGDALSGNKLEDGEVSEEEGEEKAENKNTGSQPSRRNKVCPYFLGGRCYMGNNCRMIHAQEPPSPMNCPPRGPIHPAAAMMMAAMMRGPAPGNFLRPPLPPVANMPGPGVPPLLPAGRFPFGFPFQQIVSQPQNEQAPDSFSKLQSSGETDQENNDKADSDNQHGISAAWESGLKRAKELKRQAAERRKLAAEMPVGALEVAAAEQKRSEDVTGSIWASTMTDDRNNGGNGKRSPEHAQKSPDKPRRKETAGNERKAFRSNHDGEPPVDPWRRGAAVGPHRSRPRTKSKSGSESGSGSSSASRSYSSASGSSSRSGSSASGSTTGSSYTGSFSGSGSRSSSASSFTSTSRSGSYSGSSYSGSSRSRSRSPRKSSRNNAAKKAGKSGKNAPQIPLKASSSRSRNAVGSGKGAAQHRSSNATKPKGEAVASSRTAHSATDASKSKPSASSTKPTAPPPGAAVGKLPADSSKGVVKAISKPSDGVTAPASTAKIGDTLGVPPKSTSAATQVKQQPVTAAASTAASKVASAAAQPSAAAKRPAESAAPNAPSSSAAKSAKLSKDDIMRQIAKLDAAIAKKRTTKK